VAPVGFDHTVDRVSLVSFSVRFHTVSQHKLVWDGYIWGVYYVIITPLEV
jgi:hypothetical protein